MNSPGTSKRKQKSKNYHQQMEQADKHFQELGLQRPQDECKDLMLRARQLNFGLVDCPENPNFDRISDWQPTEEMFVSTTNWSCYVNGGPKGNWIRDKESFDDFFNKLKDCSEMTIDIECHNHRTREGFICLIQIGTWNHGDFLLDPFKIRKQIEGELRLVLESETILKIGHDIRNDIKWLQRDFQIFMIAAVDTQIMYQIHKNVDSIGYKDLVKLYYPQLADKYCNETLSDWRLRPGQGMTAEQEFYAVNDVHPLLRIFDQLRHEMPRVQLIRAFNKTKERLKLLHNFLQNCDSETKYEKLAKVEFNQLKSRNGVKIAAIVRKTGQEMWDLFVALIEWRELFSKMIDENPKNLLSAEKLLTLTTMKDNELSELKKITGPLCDYAFKSLDIPRQLKIIRNILNSNGAYMQTIRTHECHNCLKIGHGPAWACPFPKNYENYALWMNREENKQFRDKQNQRRYKNLVEKVGEEKAKEITSRKNVHD